MATGPAGGPVSGNARAGESSNADNFGAGQKTFAQSAHTGTGKSGGRAVVTDGGNSARTFWQQGDAIGMDGVLAGQCGHSETVVGAAAVTHGRAIRPKAQKFVPSTQATIARSESVNRHRRCRRTRVTAANLRGVGRVLKRRRGRPGNALFFLPTRQGRPVQVPRRAQPGQHAVAGAKQQRAHERQA